VHISIEAVLIPGIEIEHMKNAEFAGAGSAMPHSGSTPARLSICKTCVLFFSKEIRVNFRQGF